MSWVVFRYADPCESERLLHVKQHALNAATDAATMILRIGDVIAYCEFPTSNPSNDESGDDFGGMGGMGGMGGAM